VVIGAVFQWAKFLLNNLLLRLELRLMLPMYEPMKTEAFKKCGKIPAEPKESIRIVKTKKT